MHLVLSLAIIFAVFLFMALMIPVLMEDNPLLLLVAAVIPVSLLHWVVTLGPITLFLCLLIICLPFFIMERSNRSR